MQHINVVFVVHFPVILIFNVIRNAAFFMGELERSRSRNRSRRSHEIFNTEYKKEAKEDEHHQYLSFLSEERLEEMFSNGDLKVLRQLCEECGIPCKRMTKIECITRLKSAIKSNCDIDKMFFKIWQGSGGVLTATCPHGIVYALKFMVFVMLVIFYSV